MFLMLWKKYDKIHRNHQMIVIYNFVNKLKVQGQENA